MEESFRRAIRKMTGKSLVRLGGRPDKPQVLAQLSQGIQSSWIVALHEHLVQSMVPGEGFKSEGELVSYGAEAWEQAQLEYNALHAEFLGKLKEFREKWQQRYTLDALVMQLQQGKRIQQDEHGFFLNMNGSAQEVKEFYYETMHFLVGDAEKLLVMVTSRCLHVQDKVSAIWLKESLHGPASKLLPCFEAGVRDMESQSLRVLREGLQPLAYKRFTSAFKILRGSPAHYPSAHALARNIGTSWNPVGAWENGFLAYLQDFCDYLDGIVQIVPEWYATKWALFLRGYSAGQMDLFRSRAGRTPVVS